MNQTTASYFVGVDIGGTNIKAVVVDSSGNVVSRADRPTENDAAALVAEVNTLVENVARERKIGAIGIASPGLASPDNQRIIWMRGRLHVVEGLVWREQLEFDASICVLNDAHAATIGEAWQGALPNCRNVVMLTLGTGVGGGVIVDGNLLQGRLGRAGHLGHICLNPAGPPDIVGTPGSLEDLVGDHTVQQRSAGAFHDTAQLVEALTAGDQLAAQVWERTVHNLACGIVSLINAFDPEIFVLGGGISNAGEQLFQPLRAKLDQYEWRPAGASVRLVAARLGEMAGAIGAARFAMNHSDW